MATNRKEAFVPRWGNVVADDEQWSTVPGYVLRNYHNCVATQDVKNDKGEAVLVRGQIVGLGMIDMMFIVHVMAFKYDTPNGKASPSLATIAEYAGVHITNIRRIKKRLIEYGLMSIHTREGDTDIYNFAPLHDQCVRMEHGLSPIEGVQIVPRKIASGSKIARGWASKIARGVQANLLDKELEQTQKPKSKKKTAQEPRYMANAKQHESMIIWLVKKLRPEINVDFVGLNGLYKDMLEEYTAACETIRNAGLTVEDLPGEYAYLLAKGWPSFGIKKMAEYALDYAGHKTRQNDAAKTAQSGNTEIYSDLMLGGTEVAS